MSEDGLTPLQPDHVSRAQSQSAVPDLSLSPPVALSPGVLTARRGQASRPALGSGLRGAREQGTHRSRDHQHRVLCSGLSVMPQVNSDCPWQEASEKKVLGVRPGPCPWR